MLFFPVLEVLNKSVVKLIRGVPFKSANIEGEAVFYIFYKELKIFLKIRRAKLLAFKTFFYFLGRRLRGGRRR